MINIGKFDVFRQWERLVNSIVNFSVFVYVLLCLGLD